MPGRRAGNRTQIGAVHRLDNIVPLEAESLLAAVERCDIDHGLLCDSAAMTLRCGAPDAGAIDRCTQRNEDRAERTHAGVLAIASRLAHADRVVNAMHANGLR